MVSRGKSRRKKELTMKSIHGNSDGRLPLAPAKGSTEQSIPAKLRRLMALKSGMLEGDDSSGKVQQKQLGIRKHNKGEGEDRGFKNQGDDRSRKREGEKGSGNGAIEVDATEGQKRWRKGESAVKLLEEEKARDVSGQRRKRFLTAKKLKGKKKRKAEGGESDEDAALLTATHVPVPFGEVVLEPPKLTAVPRGGEVGGESRQRVNTSTHAAQMMEGVKGTTPQHFAFSLGSNAMSLERLRKDAVEAYRKRHGRKSVPDFGSLQ